MNTRLTHDYSPLLPGSKAEQAAINARREMMNVFSSREPSKVARRKSWEERMNQRAEGFHFPRR